MDLGELLHTLPTIPERHPPGTAAYAELKQAARHEIERLFSSSGPRAVPFGPFGAIVLPYFNMGAVDSLNLFDLDELIIFAFYWRNRGAYRRVLDIGANIGLHSSIMSRCGWDVRGFEPDPVHFEVLERNLALNHCASVEAYNTAVSDHAGVMEFIRVNGNTTGSHLAGSKAHPYGDLERFPVPVEPVAAHVAWADLVKLDAEGHEKQILLATQPGGWRNLDALVEISSIGNAQAIFDHFADTAVNLFAQKIAWQRVTNVSDLPVSHHEGTLFISTKPALPWGSPLP